MPRETRIVHTYHYVPAPGWTDGAYTVLRAGQIETGADYGISRNSFQGQDLIFCISGGGFVTTQGRRLTVGASQFVWIANEYPHAHAADPAMPWTVVWCRINGPKPAEVRRRLFGEGAPVLTIDDADALLLWFERLFAALRNRDAATDFRLNMLVAELLWRLDQRGIGERQEKLPPALAELVEAMRSEPEASWSAAAMSEVAGLGASQIRRLFNRHFGTSPKAWLTRERLMAAQKMLAETGEPTAVIAERCGFCDVYHFSRSFKRAVGIGPAAWRRSEIGRAATQAYDRRSPT